jgi:BASS family bile acid:Na+ symporter
MDIDAIQINFNEDQLLLLNLMLGFIMFGVALDIRIGDFKRVFTKPRAPIVGLISEYLLLPLLTLVLVYLFSPPASIGLGMVMVAVCPGGSVSNFMVYLSRGNSALSVTLTSTVTIAAIIITPLAFAFWSGFVPKNGVNLSDIFVDPMRMVKTMVQLVFVPVTIGMLVNYFFPRFAKRIEPFVRTTSIIIFLGFIIAALIGNYENIVNYLHLVFLIVLVHNGLSLFMGYQFARRMGLTERDSRAVSIETGIQNSGLGLILVFNFFDGLGGMAMILAWWGVWHLISGFLLAMVWRQVSVAVEEVKELRS